LFIVDPFKRSGEVMKNIAPPLPNTNHSAQQVVSFLEQQSPFDELDTPTLRGIAKTSHLIYLATENKESLLHNHANALFLIQSGQFAVKDSASPIKHLSDGDYFGFSSLLDNIDYGLSLVVDSPGIVLCISGANFAIGLETPAFKKFFRAINANVLQNQAVSDSNSMWLYKPLCEVVDNSPLCVVPTETVQNAAIKMSELNVSSVMVMYAQNFLGILTDRDLRNRVIAPGLPLSTPVSQVMTKQPSFLTKNKTIFDAICLMNEKGIHHLPIFDAQTNLPYSMVTNTDISKQQKASVLFVISDLSKANSKETLIRTALQVPQYIASTAKRVGDFDIAGKVLAQATDIITRKLISFFEQENGHSTMPFAWLVYGSQAREDQTMGSDQDNALLLKEDPSPQQAQYFCDMANYVCDALGQCGIKLCDGNIMASNPALRLSLEASKLASQKWVEDPTNEAILAFNIYLDARAVAGDMNLFAELQKYRKNLFKESTFLAALARNANEASVPLSMFQKFVYVKEHEHKGVIDIKKSAVLIINNVVRLYALASGLSMPGTLARLNNLPPDSGLSLKDRDNLRDIWLFMNRLRWRHQLTNKIDDNFVRVSDLSSIEKHQLKAAFQAIHKTQQAVVLKFSGGIG
jgi:CBS domain-containing protein